MAGTGTAHLHGSGDRLLRVDDLVVEFPAEGGKTVHAVSGISFDLRAGETLGLLGESGCGKSSTGRAVMQLPPPTSGRVTLGDTVLTDLRGAELRRQRRQLQMIMQDPISSLNPRRRVRDLLTEGPSIWHEEVDDARVEEALSVVGLQPDLVWDRRPHELSGGQAQRVCIARAMMLDPRVLICDEPVSSLDVSVQAQILNMLQRTRERYELSMIFIAHDLSVVKNVADRIMVMYLGKVCEVIAADLLPEAVAHPYSRLLLESLPERTIATRGRGTITERSDSSLPSPIEPPSGCRFRTRCPLATDLCAEQEPEIRPLAAGQYVACHHV
jgi:peptide/nickel transport system ATP-binding protein